MKHTSIEIKKKNLEEENLSHTKPYWVYMCMTNGSFHTNADFLGSYMTDGSSILLPAQPF